MVAPIIIILPSTGGIRDRQKMLTDLPIAFLERQEITPHNNNVMIKKAYTIINARLTIPYSPQCSEYHVFLPLVLSFKISKSLSFWLSVISIATLSYNKNAHRKARQRNAFYEQSKHYSYFWHSDPNWSGLVWSGLVWSTISALSIPVNS